jgi:Holliday junction DNA helicase RuvA
MIGSLRGTVLDRSGPELLVEVAGIGYRVQVTPALRAALSVGEESFLHVHHHRRDDAELLYGFGSIEERRVFETLIGTHGVGPALALAILSVHTPGALVDAVAANDVAALCLVPGVGKKTATRLLVELSSRLSAEPIDLVDLELGVGGRAAGAKADVRDALDGLGYATEEIGRILGDLPDDLDSAELLRLALQRLAAA